MVLFAFTQQKSKLSDIKLCLRRMDADALGSAHELHVTTELKHPHTHILVGQHMKGNLGHFEFNSEL